MVEMTIYGVSFDLVGKQPIVLLKTAEGNRYLPIWIGHPEAAAILMKLQGTDAPRPLTHDLLVNILAELDVDVVRVTVTELRENTFHASITVAQHGNEIDVDSRSSDAIAVAVRAHVPIFAADEVIEESAIEMEGDDVNEEEMVSEFRRFLDRVSAEDFAEAEGEAEDDEPREPEDEDA
jgi:bifunctional DNase/RNase